MPPPLLAVLGLALGRGAASGYVMMSRCAAPRCAGAAIAWARNPKTASTVVVEDVLGLAGAKPPLIACGRRLAGVTLRHEVGCVAPCPPRAPLALAPTAGPGDVAGARALLAADLRFAVIREPVARFASAWSYLRAKHADAWGGVDAGAFVGSLLARAAAAGVAPGAQIAPAALVARHGPHTIGLWPQGYWIDAVLANASGTAAVVCYDGDGLVDDVVALLTREFGCVRTSAARRARPPREKVQRHDFYLSNETRRRLRALYARDVATWGRYCAPGLDTDELYPDFQHERRLRRVAGDTDESWDRRVAESPTRRRPGAG